VRHLQATKPVAELVVYRWAPGTVVRSRTCDNVLIVFIELGGMTCIDLTGLASLSQTRLGEPCLATLATWIRDS
jgi:hypothetical protein